MKARITSDQNWIQLYSYSNDEFEQINLCLTKKIRNHYFNPLVKKKLWDGSFCFIDKFNRIPIGLVQYVVDCCSKYNIELIIDNIDILYWDFDEEEFDKWIIEFSDKMIGKKPRDYQIDAVKKIIKYRRSISEIATSAGKTMIIFLVFSYLKQHNLLQKMLIIVPNVNLVVQTFEDFEEYSNDKEIIKYKIQTVSGESKRRENLDVDVVIGTFQTLCKLPDSWFSEINCVCGDEIHTLSSASVKKVVSKCKNANFKFGLSGTTLMNDDSADTLTMQAYMGPLINTISPDFLFKRKVATPVNIKIFRLKYSNLEIKQNLFLLRERRNEVEGSKQLAIEKDYIVKNEDRFRFIIDILGKTTKNTLVLFQNIKDNYGKRVQNSLKFLYPEKDIFYVDGSTDNSLRDEYKKKMEEDNNKILIASFGTFSTGISINNIHNIFFLESYKSEKIIKQSIGRGMRLHENKHVVNIIDIVDDLSWKGNKNYLLKQAQSRINIYKNEQFPYKIFNIDL